MMVLRRVSRSLCAAQKKVSCLSARNGVDLMHAAREAKLVAYDGAHSFGLRFLILRVAKYTF
jgi:hypothetical protein